MWLKMRQLTRKSAAAGAVRYPNEAGESATAKERHESEWRTAARHDKKRRDRQPSEEKERENN